MWELRGCPYCKETHLVNFAKPEIENFIKDRFEILQLNIIGSREVTDFDGEKLSEKRMAEKYGVRFTPTFQFFPDSVAGLAQKKPREREVARAQGYLEPQHFLALFRFVSERAYEKGSLRDYLKATAELVIPSATGSVSADLSRPSDRQSPCSEARRRWRRRTARTSGTGPSWSWPCRCSGACR